MTQEFKQQRKSWADQQGIRTAVFGQTIDNIHIEEKNRATVYERYKEGIQELRAYLQNNYRSKGIEAVLIGIEAGEEVKYAVFVQDGFLREVGGDEKE
jgi:histidinol phosphatase-like PHP family hydrolase